MIRLAVRVRRAQAEIVLADLLELVPAGVEEVELDGGLIEYAVYGSPGELPHLPHLRALAGDAPIEVSSTEVADDWEERWKRFHRPVLFASPAPGCVPALYVRPPWAPAAEGDAEEIVIDPGQAFGTGGHATTSLCLELLLELTAARRGLSGRVGVGGRGGVDVGEEECSQGDDRRLLDVGTGSGVLAIAACRLGHGPVLALDHDRASVAAAIENARANGVELDVRLVDLRREPLPDVAGAQAQIVLANLVRPLLLDLARAIDRPPAELIASGLLREEVDQIVRVFADRLGLRERERRARGEWAAVWLTGAR